MNTVAVSQFGVRILRSADLKGSYVTTLREVLSHFVQMRRALQTRPTNVHSSALFLQCALYYTSWPAVSHDALRAALQLEIF